MSSQLSAQAITAQTAITRTSIRRCSILPWQRGSSTTPRCRTRLSIDMTLSSQPRGHVIIHQARASDRNFMREPCPLEDLADGHLLVDEPVVDHAHERGFRLVDLQAPACTFVGWDVAIAVGRTAADEPAGARLLELASAEALAQERPFVFGDRALDLEQELVAGIVGDAVVEEGDLAAGAPELLKHERLVGIFAREPVGRQHRDDVDLAVAHRIAQGIQPRPVEPRAAISFVAEDMPRIKRVACLRRPGTQRGQLAVDRLLALLALCRHAGVDGGTHGSSPWSSAVWQRWR